MIHTPKKQKRWKDRHPTAYKNLVHYSIILLLLLAAVIALQPEQAAGEAIKSPELNKRVKTAQSTTPTPKPTVIAKSALLSPSQEQVADQIRTIAKEMGYQAPEFLVRLARCESSLDPKKNGDGELESRGLFQIGKWDAYQWRVHHKKVRIHADVSDGQAHDVDFSTRWTIRQLLSGHSNWWTCARLIS